MSQLSELIGEANRTREWSTRDIANRAQVAGFKMSHGTAGKVLNGNHGRIDLETVLALEAVFGIHRDKITAAADVPRIGEAYEPPRESVLLTKRQRKAVSELILSIVNEGSLAHGNAAPTRAPADERVADFMREQENDGDTRPSDEKSEKPSASA